MVRLIAISFENKDGETLRFNIPKKMQIEFKYKFGTVKEAVSFAGGMIIASPKDNMKAFLIRNDEETEEKLILKELIFESKDGEERFKIPREMSISFNKLEETDEQAADFAGMVFMRIIPKELHINNKKSV